MKYCSAYLLSVLAFLALLAGCSTPVHHEDVAETSDNGAEASLAELDWEHLRFPGKSPTRFHPQFKLGRDAIYAQAASSASMLRRRVQVPPEALGTIRFSWLVPALLEQADLATRDRDDAAVRLILAFDGDRSRLSARDLMLSELSRTLTGEEMPYATLMYVWSKRYPLEHVIVSARTERIRKVVVASGPVGLNEWKDFERDIRADFQRAFGEAPGQLVGIGLMTDTDNTRAQARAWYGPVELVRP